MIDLSISEEEEVDIQKLETKSRAGRYYYFDEIINIEEQKNLLFLQFVDNDSKKEYMSEINNVSALKIWNYNGDGYYDQENSYNTLVLQCVNGEVSFELLVEMRKRATITAASYVFKYNNYYAAATNVFSVQLLRPTDYAQLVGLANAYGCEVIRRESFNDSVFFIRIAKDSEYETLELANIFYETGLFGFSAPEFFCFNASHSADPFYYYQWGLKNSGYYGTSVVDINIESVWNTTEGSDDIVVAVFDCGVELTHPDLSPNIVSGYDYSTSFGGAAVFDDEVHGTKVAGIISAVKDNAIGISGVAPNCRLMSVRVLNSHFLNYTAAADSFIWAMNNGADVISCSWGGPPCASVTTAINTASSQGRNGKGCVIVFSVGNENNNQVSWPANTGNVVAVGAASFDGKRKTPSSPDGENWGSNYGYEVDVIAPGVKIMSTAPSSDYTSIFNGTSAAAPFVSGIAALLLSEYPDLPATFVQASLQRGCFIPSGYSSYQDGGYPAFNRTSEIGYGFIKASFALAAASQLYLQYVTDNTSGLDFTIQNWSSYDLDDVIIDVQGMIGGQTVSLISNDLFESLESGEQAGYPVYRGATLTATPGTSITNITFDLFASCIDCPGDLSIGVSFDTPTPNSYDDFEFGMGNSYHTTLPNITVPNACRRRIYVKIFDSMQ